MWSWSSARAQAARVVVVVAALAALFALSALRAPAASQAGAMRHQPPAHAGSASVSNNSCSEHDVQNAYMAGTSANECVQVCMPVTWIRAALAHGVRIGGTCAAFGCTELLRSEISGNSMRLITFRCPGPLPPASPGPPPPPASPPPPPPPANCRPPQAGDVALTSYPSGYVLAYRAAGRNGEWGAQCGLNFNASGASNADIVCRSLGYAGANSSATRIVPNAPELSEHKVVGGGVACPSAEAQRAARHQLGALSDCEPAADSRRACDGHSLDVRVHCVGQVGPRAEPPIRYCSAEEAAEAAEEAKERAEARAREQRERERMREGHEREPHTREPRTREQHEREQHERAAREPRPPRVRTPKPPQVPKPPESDEDDPASAGFDQCSDMPAVPAAIRSEWTFATKGDWWICPPEELVPTPEDPQPLCADNYLQDAWMFWPYVPDDQYAKQAECRMVCLPGGLKKVAARHGLLYESTCWAQGCRKPIGGFTKFGIRAFRYACEDYEPPAAA